jgi:hypothetical protein
MNKKLKKLIASKLTKLQQLLDNINEVQIMQPDKPETWEADLLYNLTATLKAALKLLEDQKSNQKKDPWGEPLILEEGLGSLMNAYWENEEEEEDD